MIDIPKWHQFMRPLLEVLKENGEMPRQEAIDAVVDKVGLSEEQLGVLMKVMENLKLEEELVGLHLI